MDDEFANVSDEGLQEIIYDKRNGLVRARAIRELTRRALSNHALLDDACRAISSDHEAGVHYIPFGWAGADVIFLAGDRAAMAALLKEIKNWNLDDQRFLLLRWDVLNTEATIRDFESKYDCKINFPPYKKPESSTLPTKRRDERD